MKTLKINRQIDQLGRIVIPREFRLALRVQPGDMLELSFFADSILIQRADSAQAVRDTLNSLREAARSSGRDTPELMDKIAEVEAMLCGGEGEGPAHDRP